MVLPEIGILHLLIGILIRVDINELAPDHGHQYRNISDLLLGHGQDIPPQDYQVSKFPNLYGSLDSFFKGCVGGDNGAGPNRLLESHALLRLDDLS